MFVNLNHMRHYFMIKLKLAIKLRQSVGERFSYVTLSGLLGTLRWILEDDPVRGGCRHSNHLMS
jgi:hypothetical protein